MILLGDVSLAVRAPWRVFKHLLAAVGARNSRLVVGILRMVGFLVVPLVVVLILVGMHSQCQTFVLPPMCWGSYRKSLPPLSEHDAPRDERTTSAVGNRA